MFDKIKHLLDPTTIKMLVRGLCGNREFHIPFWSMIYVALKFTLAVGDAEFQFQSKVNHGPEWNMEFLFPNMPITSIFLISGSVKIFSCKLTFD